VRAVSLSESSCIVLPLGSITARAGSTPAPAPRARAATPVSAEAAKGRGVCRGRMVGVETTVCEALFPPACSTVNDLSQAGCDKLEISCRRRVSLKAHIRPIATRPCEVAIVCIEFQCCVVEGDPAYLRSAR
jgi:hypothetical protein